MGFAESVFASFVGTVLFAIFGKWKGWWWKTKSQPSIDLATRVLKILEGEAEDKTRELVYATKQLGDSLVVFYKNKTPYDEEREREALELIEQILALIKPLSSELSAGGSDLDHLKRAIIEYQKGIEWRAHIVKHLCHPPNPPAMDPGHVRDQLLSVNILPHELLNAAKGEATLYLRGYGINWIDRYKYRRNIIKKHRATFNDSVEKEYRSVLQQTSFHEAKK